MTLNLAEASVVKSRPSFPYGANLLIMFILRKKTRATFPVFFRGLFENRCRTNLMGTR